MTKPTYDKPSDVTSEGGRVLVESPDHVEIALTPEAALETGGRLIDEAANAAGEARLKKVDHRPK